MNILVPICSYEQCKNYAEFLSESKEKIIFSCISHAALVLEGCPAKSLSDKASLIKTAEKFYRLKSILNERKSNIIQNTEKLFEIIQDNLRNSLEVLNKSIQNVDLNIKYITSKEKIFEKIEENLESHLSQDFQKNFDLAAFSYLVSALFNNLIDFQNLGPLHPPNSLFDARLLQSSTDISKKLKILLKSQYFANYLISTPSDTVEDMLKSKRTPFDNPKFLLIRPEMNKIFSINQDKTQIIVWSMESEMSKLIEIKYHSYKFKELFIIPSRNTLLARSKIIMKIDLTSYIISEVHSKETGKTTHSKLFSDQKSLATVTVSGSINIWDTFSLENTKEFLLDLKPKTAISSFDISQDNEYIISGISDGQLCLIKLKSSKIERTKSHLKSITFVCFSPNSQIVASASEDKTLKLFSTRDFPTLLYSKEVSSPVKEISFSFDSSLILTAGQNSVIFWKTTPKVVSAKITNKNSIISLGQQFSNSLSFFKYFK